MPGKLAIARPIELDEVCGLAELAHNDGVHVADSWREACHAVPSERREMAGVLSKVSEWT